MKLVGLGANNPQTIKVIKRLEKSEKDFEFLGFVDNDSKKWNSDFFSYPVFGGMDKVKELTEKGAFFCNLITRDCVTRYETSKELIKNGAKLENLIDPGVDLNMVNLGTGIYVQEHVNIQAGVCIGDNSSIHLGCQISHETIIGNSSFISVNCSIAGLVTIEDGVLIGTGASVIPRVKIGKWSVIGAGSVVIDDIPPYSLVVGNPAKVIRNLEKKYESGEVL